MGQDIKKGQVTRQRIVQKAAELFNRKGYEGTAFSDLMQATGLKKGGIFRHFASKEQLAGEAFDYAWKTAVNVRLADVTECSNAIDQIKLMVRNFAEKREGLVPGGCPLLNTAIDADDGNAILRRKVRKAMKQWLDRISAIAKQGIEKAEIKADVDPEKLATLIVGTLEGALMIGRLHQTYEPVMNAREHLDGHLEQLRATNA